MTTDTIARQRGAEDRGAGAHEEPRQDVATLAVEAEQVLSRTARR